jgi:adenylate cyclase
MFTNTKQEASIVIVGIDDVTLDELGGWPIARARYAEILPLLDKSKAVAFDIFFAEPSRFGAEDDRILVNALKNSRVPVTIPIELRDRGGVNVSLLPVFASSSILSFANIPVSDDGISRISDLKRGNAKSIACVMAGDACPSDQSIRTHYIGNERTILTLSFTDVLGGKVPESIFENAYVFIGATAQSLHDVVGTPFGDIPGVEVHAQILHMMLTGNYFHDTNAFFVVLLFLVSHLLIFFIILKVTEFRKLVLLLIALGIAIIAYPIIAFGFNIRIPFIYLFIGYVLPVGMLLLYEYISTSKEKKFIENTFKYYLMPDVIDDLKNNPHKLKLGGEKRTVTILFSDIRGFTTISENLSPAELTRVINEYLTAMTDIIMEHRGLVDKYIGDAIMAFWGAPVENANQAEDAVNAVIAMSKKLQELNIEWKARRIPEIHIGVGLNKGEVIVGNMGSEKRFNYTIMGDEVNFGSRLEGLTKKYGSECLISESVNNELKNFLIREMDTVIVKGKKEPKKIFELMTNTASESGSENKKEIIRAFEKGLDFYKQGKWDEALVSFGQVELAKDMPSQVFIERIHDLKANPPENWKGIYEYSSK